MSNYKNPVVHQLLSSHQKNLTALCQRYHVERLYLFGSATTDRITADSDLDMIVRFRSLDLPPEEQGQLYWDLLAALEQLLCREVDLLTDKKFSNPYFRQEVEKTKTLIYENAASLVQQQQIKY